VKTTAIETVLEVGRQNDQYETWRLLEACRYVEPESLSCDHVSYLIARLIEVANDNGPPATDAIERLSTLLTESVIPEVSESKPQLLHQVQTFLTTVIAEPDSERAQLRAVELLLRLPETRRTMTRP